MIPHRQWPAGGLPTLAGFTRYYVLRLLTRAWQRRIGAWLIGRLVALRAPARAAPPGTPSDPAAQRGLEDLRRDGFAQLPPLLDRRQVDEMLAWLADKPAIDGLGPVDPAQPVPGRRKAAYDTPTFLQCPHLLDAINSPAVLDLAQRYLGCRPTLAAVGLHWSFPCGDGPASVQTFHRDIEAWRMLNLFVYLTDVEADDGPHEYALGTHGGAGRLRIVPYDERELENVHVVTGPAGTTFVEDGWGVHRGRPPVRHPRLMLLAMFSVGPVPLYDYAAVRRPRAHGHDPWVNRLLFARPATIRPSEARDPPR